MSNDRYTYQPTITLGSFDEGLKVLRDKGYDIITTPLNTGSKIACEITINISAKYGIVFNHLIIDQQKYNNFCAIAGYIRDYPNYYPENIIEKSLEHYIACNLLELSKDDVFIDIASECSPAADIFKKIYGTSTFRQDIMYPLGICADRIGGDASEMPVPDGFASKAMLTCSLEHFENEADILLFEELSRVLRKDGVVVVIPFYFHKIPFYLTDPKVSAKAGVKFDLEQFVYCLEGWGNRHGRFYSPLTFKERILDRYNDVFEFNFWYLSNHDVFGPGVYARYAFTAKRR